MFHWIGAPKWALAVLMITLATSLIILSYFVFLRSQRPLMTYTKAGGFAGMSEVLTIYPDGRASLQSKNVGVKEIKLSGEEVEAVKLMLNELKSMGSLSYEARQGVADFFLHSIVSDGLEISWVDQWASRDELPFQLTAAQLMMDKVLFEALGSVFTLRLSRSFDSISIYVEIDDFILRSGEDTEVRVILENQGEDIDLSYPPLNASGECLKAEMPVSEGVLRKGIPLELSVKITAECGNRISRFLLTPTFAESFIEVPIFVIRGSD
ncbi:MAG: hypothetical protein NZ992_02665 [Candidatus Korarchaeum sp.]|nr:hypothetical protein [Candidatus Korarchaeum sp.]MDW8036345.1 hypothetical protein [Candidatus Korarchaeum sp.]